MDTETEVTSEVPLAVRSVPEFACATTEAVRPRRERPRRVRSERPRGGRPALLVLGLVLAVVSAGAGLVVTTRDPELVAVSAASRPAAAAPDVVAPPASPPAVVR
ncbi:hypothetical protein, partial [Nocardioides sp.]|uniref:hypothetical protein n=1 Tax=Nocardioides sp. TaxID=35761 RepID=UPI002716CBDE